jgi:octaprenyl-diphosphate synthase
VPIPPPSALHDYGLNLGYAFQIADDVLDYTADADALGKNLGDDLAEGKATLPLIHAMAHAGPARRRRLREVVEHGEVEALPEVLEAIDAAGSLEYSRERARNYAQAAETALAALDDNDAVAALRGLARNAVERDR